MSPRLACAWVLAGAVSAAAVGTGLVRYWPARSEADREELTLRTVAQQADELGRLRAAAPPWTRQGPPEGGLAPKVSAALSASGLPASALSSLSPEAESGLGETDLRARRSRAVLTLAPVTLPQLGAFLGEWRTREPQWIVSSIDLSPQAGGAPGKAGAGGDLPLCAVLGIETVYLAPAGGPR